MARPRKAPGTASTRTRILRESARLFSELGYEGASTRAISEAVGIKQPSLFHYFPDKESIGHELIRHRIDRSALLSGAFVATGSDPALDFFLISRDEIAIELDEQINTRWLLRIPPALAEKFPEWEAALRTARRTSERIVLQGVREGIFIPEHPAIVLDLVDAVANDAMFWPTSSQVHAPEAVAKVMMRLVLQDPQEIGRIEERAATIPSPDSPLNTDA